MVCFHLNYKGRVWRWDWRGDESQVTIYIFVLPTQYFINIPAPINNREISFVNEEFMGTGSLLKRAR